MEFKCKYCDTNICIDIDQIGNDIDCPACNRQLQIPELPEETAKALQKLKDQEKKIITDEEGNKEIAEAMLEEPASKETTMWRERLAASFQAANLSNVKTDHEHLEEDDEASELVKAFDRMLDFISIKNTMAFEEYYKLMCNFGSSFVFVFGILAIVYSIILTSKTNNILYLITGIITLFVSFVLYYLSARFSIAGFNLIKNKELYFYTRNMHHAFGMINLIATLTLLLLGGYMGISQGSFVIAMLFIIGSIATAHAAVLFISPKVLNTKISKYEVSLGETGLSLIGFVFRVYILLSGLLLAAIPILDVVIFYMIFSLIYSKEINTDSLNYITLAALIISVAPFLSYLLYFFYRIFLDFYKAVLKISGNLSLFLESLYSEKDQQ
jgi:hypothetical protein